VARALALSFRYSIIGRMPGKKPGNELVGGSGNDDEVGGELAGWRGQRVGGRKMAVAWRKGQSQGGWSAERAAEGFEELPMPVAFMRATCK
jgi:hypothetical protein